MFSRFLLLIALLISFNGCMVADPNLHMAKHDTILKLSVEDNFIAAESSSFAYYFDNKGAQNEYLLYQELINQYKNNIEGVSIIFDIKERDIQAKYDVTINTNNLDNIEIKKIKENFPVLDVKNNHDKIIVQFQANGHYIELFGDGIYSNKRYTWKRLDDKYLLKYPIVVTINDETKRLSTTSEYMLTPIIPFYMMYGCMIRRCI